MAILDTLYILFKSQGAEQVVKDEQKIEKATDDLEKSLDGLEGSFKGVGSELVNIGKSLAGVGAALLTATSLFNSMKAAVSNVQDLSRLSNTLGVDITTLDMWGKAVTQAGGDANTFNSSVKSLADNLGTSPKVALQSLLPLADAFQKLGRYRALQYGKKLGLDEATILLLQRGRRAVQGVLEEQKRLGLVTQRDKEITDAYTQSLYKSQTAYSSLARAVAMEVLPSLTKFFDVIATPAFEYLTDHKDLVIGALIAIGAAATIAAAPFIPMLATITAIVAALAALALAYEDVKFYFEGKKSLTGDIIARGNKQFYDPQSNTGDTNSPSLFDSLRAKYLENLGKGKNAVSTASGSAIGSQTSNSILNSSSADRQSTVNVGDVTINTQSTDAQGIREEFQKNLDAHFWQSNNQFANGLSIG